MLIFISFNKSNQNIQAIPLRSIWFGIKKVFNFCQR